MEPLEKRLPAVDTQSRALNVVIETPRGSRVKYSYDPESGLFMLKRSLPQGMLFPFNFGFIPGTLAEDGDALDILVINDAPLAPGTLVKARLLGVIEAVQSKKGRKLRNDRLLAKALVNEGKELDELRVGRKTIFELEQFFKAYNELDGKEFRPLGYKGPRRATTLLHAAQAAYRRRHSKK